MFIGKEPTDSRRTSQQILLQEPAKPVTLQQWYFSNSRNLNASGFVAKTTAYLYISLNLVQADCSQLFFFTLWKDFKKGKRLKGTHFYMLLGYKMKDFEVVKLLRFPRSVPSIPVLHEQVWCSPPQKANTLLKRPVLWHRGEGTFPPGRAAPAHPTPQPAPWPHQDSEGELPAPSLKTNAPQQ